jgi:hypothetical protein
MTVMELVIFYKGFHLYERKFYPIRAIEDGDVVASSLSVIFYKLQESMQTSETALDFLKMEIEPNVMHILRKDYRQDSDQNAVELYIYMIEDRNLPEKTSKPVLDAIITSFYDQFGSRLDELTREPNPLPEFDSVVDKALRHFARAKSKKESVQNY